jgi:Ca2+:H+ antiporter
MTPLLKDIQQTKLLWLLVFVPLLFAVARVRHDAQTLLFVLSVLAIVPLTVLLSHATESVAVKTGDAVGGLLNATLGNLAELVIALTALRAGQYVLVKASIAGPIVATTLFVLGASFLLGGLRHHEQEFNRTTARMQAALLFVATVALLIPSAMSHADSVTADAFSRQLSVGLALLLIGTYGLSLLFTLKTHRCPSAACRMAAAPRSRGRWALPWPRWPAPRFSSRSPAKSSSSRCSRRPRRSG